MLIHDLARGESIQLLAAVHLGRLACAHGGQPYITPLYFAYQDDCLYSFSTFGQKIEWMRANPLVCVESDNIVSPETWTSVIVLGRYEELPDTDDYRVLRTHAYNLLRRNPMWWEPGYVKTMLDGTPRALEPIYFRIHISHVTGHRASADAAAVHPAHRIREDSGWFRRMFHRSSHGAGKP